MPATEQTWRDSKLMHVVFGFSALAMLATTIWMLAADHRREWKDYQRKFQEIEAWTAQARISQTESTQFDEQRKELVDKLDATQQVVPEAAIIDRFEEAVREHAAAHDEAEPDFNEIDNAYDALTKADKEERPASRDRLRAAMNAIIKRAKFVEDDLATKKKFMAADLEVARSKFDLGVGNELPEETLAELQVTVDKQLDAVAAATDKVQEATTYRKQLESILGQMTAAEDRGEKTAR